MGALCCTAYCTSQSALIQEGPLLNAQDGTLITQKSAGRFVTSASDWKLFNKDVPRVLKEHFDNGYKVVVFRHVMQ